MRQLYKHIEIDGEEFRFFVQCSRCGKKKYGPGLPLICRNVKTLVRCTGGRANRLAQLLYNHRKANAVQRLAMSFNQCRYCREWVCDECYDTNNSQGACKSCSDKIKKIIKKEDNIMKKIMAVTLILLMGIFIQACGGEEEEKTTLETPEKVAEETKNDEKIDVEEVVEKALEEAEEFESFSLEAVEHYLKAYGIDFADLEPDWEWELANDYCAYADDPGSGYGHATVKFNRTDGELTDEEINNYFAAVFEVTAAASDDGYNIIGYEFAGDGEDALSKTTLEDSLGGWMQGWGFRKDGQLMVVYVYSDYDNEKESELDRLFYYNAVEFDIGVGLQKSFDDTWKEMEEYFEENEDEIKEALEEYVD